MAQTLTLQEQQWFTYLVAMYMDEDGCDRKDAEELAWFDVESCRGVGKSAAAGKQ